MDSYNYATAYWKNEQNDYGEGFKSYTNTLIYLLNPNDRRAFVEVYFYDLQGNEYTDMTFAKDDELLVEHFGVYDMRVVDLIPDPIKKDESRQGWLRFKSNMPLVISGKIVKGTISPKSNDVTELWSIPFNEYPIIIDPVDGPSIYKKPDASHWKLDKKRIPPPKPFG